MDGTFDDTIVVLIAGHYIKSDLRHDPHSAFADYSFSLARRFGECLNFVSSTSTISSMIASEMNRRTSPASAISRSCCGLPPQIKADTYKFVSGVTDRTTERVFLGDVS